ncbi:PREDICTED: WAT1-related protein At1g68170-like [Nicotiana attenuata]|uniref:WAT1-related protein n=1 Tax=Nicotiana attenuata TaxID=49451 RepID=A0A314LE48_NICAT|nr:PREDICTED: WAT1-related protein At1g68170-like [Nicotiana attenuata]OIT39833.1 wat1-related protein [Nicotiana attenuata]
MGKICDKVQGLKPVIMMVFVQIAYAGMSLFYKLASNNGMSLRVLIAYRFIFAAATVIPLALYFDRKIRPKLTWMVMLLAFLCALFGGSMAQNLFAASLVLTSATFATAMINLIPGITFVIAIFFRLEKLGLKTRAGQAKVLGTLIGIGGAMLLTFYKGLEIKTWSTKVVFTGHMAASHQHQKPYAHILGPILAICSCFSTALSLIFQAKMSELYPCHFSSTALISIMGALQAGVFALCTERDWSQWKLGWNLRLLIVAYAGIVASGITIIFLMFCVRMRGPLFLSIFTPLMLVCVAIAGSLFLSEKLHLGSVLGAAIIIFGLYVVLWGKNQEIKRASKLTPSKSSDELEQEDIVSNNKLETNCSNVIGIAPNFHPMNKMEGLSLQQALKEEEGSINLDSKV